MAKSNEYWRKRELEHIAQRKKDDTAIAKRLHDKYRESIDDIQEKIEAFYGRYAGTEGITMKEARKKISKLDIEKYGNKAKKYVKERDFTKTANEELRLYNATMRINRLELLKKDIQLDLLALSSDEERQLQKELTKEIRAEYRRQSGILGMTVEANAKHIAAIVDSSFLSATWSDRIWNNHTALRSELDKLLNRGIVQGLNPRELAKDLRKNIETSSYNAERLMRTEMARVQQDVFQDSMRQAEIDQYTYIAEPDACDICAELDDEVFDLDKAEIGVNTYPMHPNCRCSTSAYVDRDSWEKKVKELEELAEPDNPEGIVFTDSIKGNMSDEQQKALEEMLNKAPEDVQNLWTKVQDDLVTVSATSKKSYYRRGEGVNFNFADDSTNETRLNVNGKPMKGKENYTTFFREYGHHIDSLYGSKGTYVKKYKGKKYDIDAYFYKSKELGISDSLKTEVKDTMKEFGAKNIGDLAKTLQGYAEENYPYGYSGVSDIISGLTGNRVHMGWKHDRKYWNAMKDTDGLGKEAFAHMFAAHTMQGEANEFMEKVFPKSYKKAKDFIKEAGK